MSTPTDLDEEIQGHVSAMTIYAAESVMAELRGDDDASRESRERALEQGRQANALKRRRDKQG